jgi:DNA-binding CsgD family transcriptional regulator
METNTTASTFAAVSGRLSITSREAQVLHWLAVAKTNREIGTILGVSSRTVGKHVENILAKLGVENRTAAAMHALEVLREN